MFRRRYNLPPSDPRFLDATMEDITVDLWAHLFHDYPKERNAVVATGFDDDLEVMERQAAALPPEPAPELPDDLETVEEGLL